MLYSGTDVVELMLVPDAAAEDALLVPDVAAEDVLLALEVVLDVDAVGWRGFTRLPNKSPVVPAALELDPVPVVEPVDESSPLNISDNERFDDEEDENDDDDVMSSWEEVS